MKDDYSYWSENLHSAYLFYTMEVDRLNKENKLLREALEKINSKDITFIDMDSYRDTMKIYELIAKQALGE